MLLGSPRARQLCQPFADDEEELANDLLHEYCSQPPLPEGVAASAPALETLLRDEPIPLPQSPLVHEGLALAKLTLTDVPDEVLGRICMLLGARDLASLACLSRRLSVHAEETGRRKLAACAVTELGWISQEEQSELARLHEVETLRSPPTFARAHGTMVIGAGGTEVLQDPARRSPQAARSWSSSARAAGAPSVCPSVRLCVCLSVRLPVCLPACLSVCLPACLPVCLSVCLSARL